MFVKYFSFCGFCPWQPGLKLNCTNFLPALTAVSFCCLSSTHVDHPNFCSPRTVGLACGSGSHIERYSPSMHHGSLGGMFGGGTLGGGRERYLQCLFPTSLTTAGQDSELRHVRM